MNVRVTETSAARAATANQRLARTAALAYRSTANEKVGEWCKKFGNWFCVLLGKSGGDVRRVCMVSK